MAIVNVEQLVKVYEGKKVVSVRALDGVDLIVTAGEFTAIAGPSGSGKTTLLNTIGGIDTPTSGFVSVDGQNLSQLNGNKLADFRLHNIGFIFQAYNLIPVLTAAENVEVEALRNRLMEGSVSFSDILEVLSCRIDGSSIEYLAHWITPEREPRRFDTRFFAARVQEHAKPIFDPREMTEALWLNPKEALSRNQAGTLPMIFPTIDTLQRLADYRTVGDALRGIGSATIPTLMPKLVLTEEGVRLQVGEEEP